ncbi:MAG TPA: hypothetical protein VF965_04810 [Candidatus Limnocylindria bacterium]
MSKLKASLSGLLQSVIARLRPAASSPSLTESLREMERQGLAKLGTGKLPEDFWRMPRPKDPKGLVMKGMLEERAERR